MSEYENGEYENGSDIEYMAHLRGGGGDLRSTFLSHDH